MEQYKSKRIIAINGGYKGRAGYSHFLIEKLFDGAKKADAVCEEILLAEVVDLNLVLNKLKNADIIIYATPVYVFGISGLMKVFMDKISTIKHSKNLQLSNTGLFLHYTDDIFSKPFITLISHDNFAKQSTKQVLNHFKAFSKFMNVPHIGSIVRSSGRISGNGESYVKESQYPGIKKSYIAIEKAGMELVINGKINKRTEKLAAKSFLHNFSFNFGKQLDEISNYFNVSFIKSYKGEAYGQIA